MLEETKKVLKKVRETYQELPKDDEPGVSRIAVDGENSRAAACATPSSSGCEMTRTPWTACSSRR